ncbi:hypothetical protein ABH310_10665 [Chromobacterium piscinae]
MQSVKLVEVGPRDGLQNEKQPLSAEIKLELIRRLAETGLSAIEAGAFVSPKWVPQMAGSAEVLAALDASGPIAYPVLVPNDKGLDAALAAGAREIAVFGAASESFSQKNINASIAESLQRFESVARRALDGPAAISPPSPAWPKPSGARSCPTTTACGAPASKTPAASGRWYGITAA